MEKQDITIDRYISYGFFLFFGVGIVGHLLPFAKAIMLQLTPFILYASVFIVIIRSFMATDSKKWLTVWLIAAFLFGFICEVAGVATGFPFGSYSYSSILGYSLFEVPLVIGLNWMIVILGLIVIFQNVSSILVGSAAVGVGAVVFDFILEPVAISLKYWTWNHQGIPVQNYISWFVISFILAFLFLLLKIKISNSIASWYLLVQFMFFTALRVFLA